MRNFYVSLPSNTPGMSNTTSSFRVHLAEEISLDSGWEVALVEFQYPFSWYNVNDELEYKMRKNQIKVFRSDKETCNIDVPVGFYENIDSLLGAIMLGLTQVNLFEGKQTFDMSRYLWFDLDFLRQKVVMKGNANDKVLGIQLSTHLQYILGFESPFLYCKKQTTAKYPPDVGGGSSALYLYCDVIQPQLVGDKREQLLRIIPVSGSYGNVIGCRFIDAHYVPVLKSKFSSIEISIKSDVNTPIAFQFGKSVVKLHFRKRILSL